jgi:hypothetical protein
VSTSIGFRLNLACDNAAFEDDNLNHEIARCLRAVADRIEAGEDCGKYRNILDVNGNIVGAFKCAPRDEL